jgi:putative toxin-antitoxin system antitoxin component (TIGR02293 family)
MKTKETTSLIPDNLLQEPTFELEIDSYYQRAAMEVSKFYIKKVLEFTRLSIADLIEIIPISIDTYKRKSAFNSGVTEKVLEIEEVYHTGVAAFGDSFHQWMDTRNIAMGGVTPKALLKNSFGIRLILDEIGRMEHGVLA